MFINSVKIMHKATETAAFVESPPKVRPKT